VSLNHPLVKIAHFFLQCVGAILMFGFLWFTETTFFPVVKDFKILNLTQNGSLYTVSGTLNKTRACEFVGLTLYAVKGDEPKILLTQYKKDVFGADVGNGKQTWGPWSVELPSLMLNASEIQILGTHRCHAFWLQTTEYARLDLKTLKAAHGKAPD
jgi:hypothetical protein